MSQTTLTEELMRAEGLLIQGQDESARELLARLAEDAEEYVDRNCPTTETLQWFSFPTIFERLAYRRVEEDPRELRDVGEPLDRLYADLALADIHVGDYDHATEALKQAAFRVAGDMREYLALTYSVFERASEASHLVRAYLTFAEYFQVSEKPRTAAAALRAARRLDTGDTTLEAALDQAAGTDRDPDSVSDEEAAELLAAEGLPDAANAEIAICLLMCAADAAAMGQRDVATNLTLRARDLVGEEAAMALLALIHEEDSDAN